MFKLIYYQFKYSKKQWFGMFPLFFASSLLVGMCLSVAFSTIKYQQVFRDVGSPTLLFVGPVLFGGFTLLFLVSGLIRLFLNLAKEDYRQWSINGGSRVQLSLLISGQLTIFAFLVSIVGSFFSIFCARFYYSYAQYLGGEKLLPTIPIDFSISAFLLTILIICLLAFIGSFLYLYKILGNAVLLGDRFDSRNHFVVKIIKVLGFAISLGFWLKLLIPFFTVSVNKPNENLLFRLDDSILLILVMHLFLLAFISPHIQIFLTKILLAWRSSYDFVMAKWIILKDKEYLKSLTVSISIIAILISELMIYSDIAYSNLAKKTASVEINAVLLFFVVGPLVVVIANLISITVLSSVKEKEENLQWERLGISHKQTVTIRSIQAITYAVIMLISTVFFNIIFFVLMHKEALLLGIKQMNYGTIIYYPIIISIVMYLFVFITKSWFDVKNKAN